MKIGILTLPFNNNYGGYMQAYALMTVLKRMGHEPTLIMRRHNPYRVSIVFRIKFFIKGILKTIIRHKIYPFIYGEESSFRARGKNMLTFVDKYIQPQTRYIYSTDELRKECEGHFDAFIVGSDQVWRPIYVQGLIGNMFLDFTTGWNVKRIAYAASFGTDAPEYTEEAKVLCGSLIEKFDAVSVREQSGLNVFDDFGWKVKNPKVVLDPTMLLTREDYNKVLTQESNIAKGKIFCYVLDNSNEVKTVISKIQKQIKKTIYEITDIQKGDSVLSSIETWMSAIRDSDFVITDSFHGTVFAIIFNKPFIVYANKNRGIDRFRSILNHFGLEDRISNSSCSINEIITKQVNWDSINEIIRKNKEVSIIFLEGILNHNNK